MTENNIIVKLVTVQTSAFKNLIDGLKDMLFDCNMEIIPNDDNEKEKNGFVKILAVNNQHGMLIHLRLLSFNFDEFICTEKQTIGINMQVFHKVIKTINNNHILTIFKTKNDPNKLGIKIMDKDKKQVCQYNLPIIDVDTDVLDVSQASFQAVIVMNSADFQKVCKDMNGIEAKYVDITLINNVIKISAKGEFAHGSAEFSESPNGSITINRKDEAKNLIITGKYELKNLLLFTKCTNLCSHIEIYLKNDYPLLLKYTVASLGYMHLCLSPIIDDS
jgi:proliferating cell nuclear antigen